jgi:hypothetical protein
MNIKLAALAALLLAPGQAMAADIRVVCQTDQRIICRDDVKRDVVQAHSFSSPSCTAKAWAYGEVIVRLRPR